MEVTLSQRMLPSSLLVTMSDGCAIINIYVERETFKASDCDAHIQLRFNAHYGDLIITAELGS